VNCGCETAIIDDLEADQPNRILRDRAFLKQNFVFGELQKEPFGIWNFLRFDAFRKAKQ
jgi:hypothetical protein